MTALLLIRHASHPWLGKALVGRQAGVSLSPDGEAEALALAERLQGTGIDALYTSPLERCRQTADAIAAMSNVEPQLLPEINEIDFGTWTGRTFSNLQREPSWEVWNCHRASARPPGGESMREVQQRVLDALTALYRRHPGQLVSVVSHGDVLKAALLDFLNMSLDLHSTVDLLPARVSIVGYHEERPSVLLLNDPGERVPPTIAAWRSGTRKSLRLLPA